MGWHVNWIVIWKYKYWIAIAVLSFVCLGQLAYTNHLAGELIKADAEKAQAVADAIKPFEAAVKEQQDKLNQASADYETLKSERQVKTETVTREIQKIIERPVYSNICIDDDGLHKINSLITNNTS